jgi:uncharacterized protein involved in outer membrane biogenesis
MSRFRRPLLVMAVIAGILLSLLVAFHALLPVLIEQEAMKQRIQAFLSHKVKAEINYGKLDLSLLPRPSATIHEGSLSIPGEVTADATSLTICPKVLPLLIGKLRLARVRVELPHVEMNLPKMPKKTEGPSAEAIKDKVNFILSSIRSKAPGLVVRLEKGQVRFVKQNDFF